MPTPAVAHFVIFPFMAQGHTLPLLDLAKALSCQQIKVTIITTPSNANSISMNNIAYYPNIYLTEIPFPTVDGLPKGCENTSQLPSMEYYVPFLYATKQLQKPFQQLLETILKSDAPPTCVISDFFLGWTLSVCQALGVPRLVFHGMSTSSMAISKSLWVHKPFLNSTSMLDHPLDFPNMKLPFTLTTADVPLSILNARSDDQDDQFTQFIEEAGQADVDSWGIVVNSFAELERSYIPYFESFYRNGAKAWCLGPLFIMHDNIEGSDNEGLHSSMIMEWLDEQVSPDSVIYVSFGTQADVSDAQLDEVAFGLEQSGFPFVWLVRSKTWSMTNAMEEKMKGKGLVIRELVNQRQILSHRATGGFLSHCGWNSVLESMAASVPILAWPMMAEQPLNAKLIVDGLGAGLSLKSLQNIQRCNESSDNGVVSGDVICQGVRELMGEENGRGARERALALARLAREAVHKGGSSRRALTKLIDQLRARSTI